MILIGQLCLIICYFKFDTFKDNNPQIFKDESTDLF